MSTTTAVRTGRSYTRARTFPWLLGKIGDFVLWLGPYNAQQLIIAAVGALVLIKTFSWWAPAFGPIPVVALGVAVWAARAGRIGGRRPLWVAYGLLQRVLQPSSGRIGGRTARLPRPSFLAGGFLIEHAADDPDHPQDPRGAIPPHRGARALSPRRAAVRPAHRHRPAAAARAARASGPAPTPLQHLLHTRLGQEPVQ